MNELTPLTTDLEDDDLTMIPKHVDAIINPHHYTQGAIQPIDFIVSNGMNFLEGNVVKYLTRWRHKNGVEDLKKALRYLTWLIEDAQGGFSQFREGEGK